MRFDLRAGAVAAGFVVCAWGLSASSDASGADGVRTHEIVIQALQYRPETLKVRRGDVVVWVNKDPFPHTATAPKDFDSGSIAADGSWRFTASRAGVLPYICTLHPNMKGTLQVD
ncbi:MAG: cupredoxin family copper-binding protein [Caldimonas sp.]